MSNKNEKELDVQMTAMNLALYSLAKAYNDKEQQIESLIYECAMLAKKVSDLEEAAYRETNLEVDLCSMCTTEVDSFQ